MKHPGAALTKGWFSAISGNVGYPVYDGIAPENYNGSYVLISQPNCVQSQDKGGYTWTCNIIIDCVLKSGNFGFKDSDTTASAVMALIDSDNQLNLAPDFKCVQTSVLSLNNLPSLNATEPTFRTIIRYQHIIQQL